MSALEITSTGKLNYHLKMLNGLVEKNQDGLYLLTEKGKLAIRLMEEFCETWVLLVSRCSDEIRCELSLPNEIGEDGRVVNWDERIILPPVHIDNGATTTFSEEEGADDIVVEILRRDTQP